MSIVRWGVEDSDVYAYTRVGDYKLVCYGCFMNDHESVVMDTPEELLEHFEAHRKAGDKVPDYVFDYLREEIRLSAKELAAQDLPEGGC